MCLLKNYADGHLKEAPKHESTRITKMKINLFFTKENSFHQELPKNQSIKFQDREFLIQNLCAELKCQSTQK